MSGSSPATPSGGGPEYLEQGGGAVLPGATGDSRRGRTALWVGGAVGVAAVVGGGVWMASAYFGTGAQPAEALPASTLGFASVDLDPSGEQKVEALRTLRKFPAFEEKLGLRTDDDLRRKLFEWVQDEGGCPDADYADDVEPWLGNRAAVAAVDRGEDAPTPVVVLQVTDAAAAEAGFQTLQQCGSDGGDGEDVTGGWAVDGDWAVLAETDEIAGAVLADAADQPLSDDADYQRWMDELGDPGFLTLYAAPEAGATLTDLVAELPSGTGGLDPDGLDEDGKDPGQGELSEDQLAQLRSTMEDFEGAAAALRFADGGLELEAATQTAWSGLDVDLAETPAVGEAVTSLPGDTVAALGFGVPEDYVRLMMDQMTRLSDDGDVPVDDIVAEIEAQTGLSLPEDVQTLLGESVVLVVGGDIDADTLANSADGSDVPAAAKITGDAEQIQAVLDKIRPRLGTEAETVLGSDADGDVVVVGPDAAYREQLLGGGDLGGVESFRDVVPEAEDALSVVYLDFDAADDWLVQLAEDTDPEAAENLAPLSAVGMSGWAEGESVHLMLRVSTD